MAAVAAVQDRRRRKRRLDARQLPQPLTAGGRGRRHCYSDATVLVTGVKYLHVTATHSRYQNGTLVTSFKIRYS